VIVQCPQCEVQYQYGEERFGARDTKKLRCFRCAHLFEVHRSSSAAPEPAGKPDEEIAAATEPPEHAEDLFEVTLRSKERALAEELPDEPPPPKRKRKAATPRPEPAPIDVEAVRADGDPRLPAGYRLSLAVINSDGPDAGKVFRIEQPRIVIGRSAGDVGLTDDEISRSHAAIEVRDSVILLEDLGSTNGTIHKGKVLDGAVPLYNHSEFQVGNTTLMLIVTRE
jgi:predicted Zn finger-like uncharacterized protein